MAAAPPDSLARPRCLGSVESARRRRRQGRRRRRRRRRLARRKGLAGPSGDQGRRPRGGSDGSKHERPLGRGGVGGLGGKGRRLSQVCMCVFMHPCTGPLSTLRRQCRPRSACLSFCPLNSLVEYCENKNSILLTIISLSLPPFRSHAGGCAFFSVLFARYQDGGRSTRKQAPVLQQSATLGNGAPCSESQETFPAQSNANFGESMLSHV